MFDERKRGGRRGKGKVEKTSAFLTLHLLCATGEKREGGGLGFHYLGKKRGRKDAA